MTNVLIQKELDWAQVPVWPVKILNWGGTYLPEVTVQIAYVENKEFAIRMTAAEASPRAVVTEKNGPVSTDSCLEAFLNFAPDQGDAYINLECNVIGALHCAFGPGRNDRVFVCDRTNDVPVVLPFKEDACWGLEYHISLDTITALYGPMTFTEGSTISANFYKCGDLTEVEHYITWAPITSPNPDYHRPECFQPLVLAK